MIVAMFAVIASGGKQHHVTEGEVLRLEKIEAAVGDAVEFNEILMMGKEGKPSLGQPYVEGGKVVAEVLGHHKGEKVKVLKFKRRKGYLRQQGHRQWYTEIKITGISA